MIDQYTVVLGPATVQVKISPRFSELLRQHLKGFLSSEGPSPDVEIRMDLGGSAGRRIPVRSKEVYVEASGGSPLVVNANLVMTPRAVLRRMKRALQPDHWLNGRWRLLLRNSFELGSLATLESIYGYVAVHSATVMGADGCVLLIGGNGAGKSTLACAAIESLGLELLSDNFTPCNGEYALGYPGKPRAKPGDLLPSLKTVPATSRVRGIVALDINLSSTHAERIRQLRSYLGLPYDSHRGTGYESVFAADLSGGGKNDRHVAERLAALPFLSFDYRTSDQVVVERFIRDDCGISRI